MHRVFSNYPTFDSEYEEQAVKAFCCTRHHTQKGEHEVHHRWKNMENEKNKKRGVNGGNLPRNPQKYL